MPESVGGRRYGRLMSSYAGVQHADGPVVVGSLSPSRATDFMTCPLLYRFRQVDRLPEPPSPASTRGSVVHAVLEQLLQLPAGQRSLDQALGLLEPTWQAALEADPEVAALFPGDGSALAEWLGSARELLAAYFRLEDPDRLGAADLEPHVEVVLESGLRLHGYIDRLDRSPAGDLRIVDYKTGRSPREAFEAKAMFQLKFYALVLWRTEGRVPRELRLLYLADEEILRYRPDESELRAVERKLTALWAAIDRAQRSGHWPASPSRLCEWCSFQALCPAFGGTPPALPEQRVRPQVADLASS